MTSKEALERLKFIVDNELNTGSKSYKDLQEFWNYKEPLKVIEDLVERDTPIKLLIYEGGLWNDFICPICESAVCEMNVDEDKKFCNNCGQRLDWSRIIK